MLSEKIPLTRRAFIKNSLVSTISFAYITAAKLQAQQEKFPSMRLGGPTFGKLDGPDAWVKAIRELGYNAAYCPVGAREKDDVVKAYARAAEKANIIIAEVGAWSNPISPDKETRRQALAKCRSQLALADRIGANCCVNISGSVSENWAGPSPKNLTKETFDMIVETTREIIDDVKPTRTFFTLETMPWAYPDSPDSYLSLIKAIDRKRFAVHLDPVNLICSPQRYFKKWATNTRMLQKTWPLYQKLSC